VNQLQPIIRRKRRLLVVSDSPPVVVGNVELVRVDAQSGEQAKVAAENLCNAETSSSGDAGPAV